MNKKARTGVWAFKVLNTILMLFILFITLYPFLYLVAQSFSSDASVSAGRVRLIPVDFNIDTYKYILRDGKFFRYYANTIMDLKTERRIFEDLKDRFKNMTVIVIDHRLSAMRLNPDVVLMEDGGIAESGKYDYLKK